MAMMKIDMNEHLFCVDSKYFEFEIIKMGFTKI